MESTFGDYLLSAIMLGAILDVSNYQKSQNIAKRQNLHFSYLKYLPY